MGLLIAGTVIFFIAAIIVVMGTPYMHFMKLDREWEAAQRAGKEVSWMDLPSPPTI